MKVELSSGWGGRRMLVSHRAIVDQAIESYEHVQSSASLKEIMMAADLIVKLEISEQLKMIADRMKHLDIGPI